MEPSQVIEWLSVAGFVAAHAVAMFGEPKWMPSWGMKIINALAGNYRKAKNLK